MTPTPLNLCAEVDDDAGGPGDSGMVQDGQSLADIVASTSIDRYNSLPKHGKPQVRSNRVPEWTILATLCVVSCNTTGRDPSVRVISLGTGVKCLPANKLPPCGDTLHDGHAEVLARRGFVRWLIQQAQAVTSGDESDVCIQLDKEKGRFKLRSDIQVWLYVSTLPCGDASTLHTAAHQPADMAALKNSAEGQKPLHSVGTAIRGRNGYEAFGAIRTKPGRADSVPSISFSCSDKIASWSVLGLQGALLAGRFEPVYLEGIVVGGIEEPPESWSLNGDWSETIRKEVQRAAYGRLECIADHLEMPYTLHRPKVHITSIPFSYAKDQVCALDGRPPVPSVSCLLQLPSMSLSEVLFNGGKAATWKAPGLEVLPEKHRSAVCKLELMKAFMDLEDTLSPPRKAEEWAESYFGIKHSAETSAYQQAKNLLRGIPGNDSELDSAFGATGPFAVSVDAPDLNVSAPFRGWIISGQKYESFNREGAVHGVER